MRERIADEHRDPPIWHVKHVRGGLVDIEFIMQFLQLRDAATKPKLLEVNTLSALKKLMVGGSLAPDAADEDAATPALKALLAAGADAADFAALEAKMHDAAHRAFARYEAIVAKPAATARDKAAAPTS